MLAGLGHKLYEIKILSKELFRKDFCTGVFVIYLLNTASGLISVIPDAREFKTKNQQIQNAGYTPTPINPDTSS